MSTTVAGYVLLILCWYGLVSLVEDVVHIFDKKKYTKVDDVVELFEEEEEE